MVLTACGCVVGGAAVVTVWRWRGSPLSSCALLPAMVVRTICCGTASSVSGCDADVWREADDIILDVAGGGWAGGGAERFTMTEEDVMSVPDGGRVIVEECCCCCCVVPRGVAASTAWTCTLLADTAPPRGRRDRLRD